MPRRPSAALASARERIVAAIGDDVFSIDGRPMEEIVGGLLLSAGSTIAVAESCSGGLLLSRLTDIPGSSAYVRGGVVAYSNDVKTAFADVPAELIAEHGAVSEPVAHGDGRGHPGAHAGDRSASASPASPGRAAARRPSRSARSRLPWRRRRAPPVKTVRFNGSRAQIKHYASQSALDMVRRVVGRDAALHRD